MADVNQNTTLYNVWKIYKNWQEYMLDWTMLSEYNTLQQQYSDYQSSINGIQANLKTSIENKWVTVPSSAALSTYPSYINQISTVWPNDDMRYIYAVGSIDTDIIGVGSDNYLFNQYQDISFKDSNYLYLIKPYEMNIRSSTNRFNVYCMAIPRWWNTIISLDTTLFSFSSVSSDIVLSYYYINSWVVRFYWYEYRYDARFWKELTLSNWAWSVTDIWWDWTKPAETWGSQNLFYTTLRWNASGRSQCHFQWKPNSA